MAPKVASKKKITKKARKKSLAKKADGSATLIYKKNPEVLSRAMIDGTISIVHINNLKSYFKVDAWAAEIWKMIDGKNNLQKIIQKIHKSSKIDEAIVKKETNKLIQQLLKAKFLTKST